MIPAHYVCTLCPQGFCFPFREAYYYLGTEPLGQSANPGDFLLVPVKPAWCIECRGICIAEDILDVRQFEAAYGAVRVGKEIEYPVEAFCMDRDEAIGLMAKYLHWRMERRHGPRVLCCGGSNFQFMDVEQPLFKHADCGGIIKACMPYIGSRYAAPVCDVQTSPDARIFDTEGELIGTSSPPGDGDREGTLESYQRKWEVAPMRYGQDDGV